MAAFEFRLPDIGEGVTEGEIVEWHVKPGDQVAEDVPMVEVMTDKATVTIGAPRTGTIAELRCAVGATARVGEILVIIDGADAAAAASGSTATGTSATGVSVPREASPPHSPPGLSARTAQTATVPSTASAQSATAVGPHRGNAAATAVGDIRESLPGVGSGIRGPIRSKGPEAGRIETHGGNGAGQRAATRGEPFHNANPLATPATRKLARGLGIDLANVRPSGKGGRTTKEDVEAFARGGQPSFGTTESSTASPFVGAAAGRAPMVIRAPDAEAAALEERRPFVGIRRKIAERMQIATNTAAHFTFVEECDVDRLVDLRNRLRSAAAEQDVKLSFLPFVVKAVVAALKRHPILNSALDESTNELVLRRYYDIGIAASTDAGLMVPVLRNADRLSILEVAREIERLGEGARAGSLKSNELSGSTFTITSLGKQGGLFATPVLNFPEVGILGVHQMKEKPVVRGGEIVIGQVMLLSLSFDHRIVDGHIGAAFAYDIIDFLQNPDRLFLEMA